MCYHTEWVTFFFSTNLQSSVSLGRTLSDAFTQLCLHLNHDIQVVCGAQAAFLPAEEKAELVKTVKEKLAQFDPTFKS